MASPGYGSGASKAIGNKVVHVPLRKDYTHDVEAMIKADPNAGAYYVCNPNNPTGTLIAERMDINTRARDLAFEQISKLTGTSAIPSVSNFFMMSVAGMTGVQVNKAMAAKQILIAGDRWPEWPRYVRVTVGTYEEMTRFNAALAQVVQEGPPATAPKATA